MKFPSSVASSLSTGLVVLCWLGGSTIHMANADMVKMCIFYGSESGHARTDPIIDQTCASDHVHTFYGPQQFHPDTTYDDLRATSPEFSTAPFLENQSLYWHPSIYEVFTANDGTKTYQRVSNLETSPYYRWDSNRSTVEFPRDFRMIAHSNDFGANQGGESGGNMLTECCNLIDNGTDEPDEDCQTWDHLHFPTRKCDFLGIAFAMPTCWDGNELGINNDHKSHMRYTEDGSVRGNCPSGFDTRLPQVQLFVRIAPYNGGEYTLADESTVFHVDFFNGWEVGVLDNIINTCQPSGDTPNDYNPPCDCDGDLTPNPNPAGVACDSAVRTHIIDEATDVVNQLPRGTKGSCPVTDQVVPKSWDLTDPPSDFANCNTNPPPPPPPPPTEVDCYEFETGEFEFLQNDVYRYKDCEWLVQRDHRVDRFCNRMDTEHEQKIYFSCPDECGCYTEYPDWEDFIPDRRKAKARKLNRKQK